MKNAKYESVLPAQLYALVCVHIADTAKIEIAGSTVVDKWTDRGTWRQMKSNLNSLPSEIWLDVQQCFVYIHRKISLVQLCSVSE